MKQKKIVPLLALLSVVLLPSCSNNGSNTTPTPTPTTPTTPTPTPDPTTPTTPAPTPDPTTPDDTTPDDTTPDDSTSVPEEVTYENYTRKGSLSLDLSAGGIIGTLAPSLAQASYNSEVLYTFEKASDGSMTDDAELLIHPNVVVAPGEDSPYSVSKNFSTLYTIFGFPSSLGSLSSLLSGMDMPSLPDDLNLAGNAYNANATAETPTDEELAVRLVSGNKATFTATSEDKLRAFDETDVSDTFETIAGLDLTGMVSSLLPMVSSMDIATILNLVDGLVDNMLPEETLRPILVAVGDAIDILSEGLDVDIQPDENYADGASSVTLSLNEAGLEQSSEALNGLMAGNDMASLISLDLSKASVTLEFFNESDKELTNQLGGLSLDLGLDAKLLGGILTAPINLSLDLSFDRESTEATKDYFDGIPTLVDGYRKTDEAFHTYYDKVKPYLTDTSAIDLTSATAATIADLQKEYEGLSEDVKFMLGNTVSSDAIAKLYKDGRELLGSEAQGETEATGLVKEWDALTDKRFESLSKVQTFLGNVRNYASWREAIAELGDKGTAILTAIDKTVSDTLEKAKTDVDKYVSDLDSYTKNPDDETAVTAIVDDLKNFSTFEDIDDDSYFYLMTDKQQEEATSLYSKVKDFKNDTYKVFADNVLSKLTKDGVTIDYALLKECVLGTNTLYAKYSSSQTSINSLLSGALAEEGNADLLKKVTSLIDNEIENVKKEVVSKFKTTQDKASWDTYKKTVNSKLQEINKLAKAYLGQSTITGEVSTLLNELSAYFAA